MLCFTTATIFLFSPAQGLTLQTSLCKPSPWHGRPPCRARGLSQSRLRVLSPCPQVALQSPHGSQFPHSPFTEINKHSESIAKAIQVPYRPQQIFKRHNSNNSRSKGPKSNFKLINQTSTEKSLWKLNSYTKF